MGTGKIPRAPAGTGAAPNTVLKATLLPQISADCCVSLHCSAFEFTAEHRAGEGSVFLCHRETHNSLCSGKKDQIFDAEKCRIAKQSMKRTAPWGPGSARPGRCGRPRVLRMRSDAAPCRFSLVSLCIMHEGSVRRAAARDASITHAAQWLSPGPVD